jgi:hypothetical protein
MINITYKATTIINKLFQIIKFYNIDLNLNNNLMNKPTIRFVSRP